MSYMDTVREHARISILKFLSAAQGYTANASLLTDALTHVGVGLTRDQVRSEIGWLEEQGLVTKSEVEGLTVATVTERGLDVVAGRATVPGVKRPSPSR